MKRDKISNAPVYFIEIEIPTRKERKNILLGEKFDFIIQNIEIVKNKEQKNDKGTSTIAYCEC